MKIAIVDDFDSDRQRLKDFIIDYANQNNMIVQVKTFSSGEGFLEAFKSIQFDVVFMDIFMNGITGMETAQKIREHNENCFIIFVTQTPEFAVRSFRVRAFDYLVKPYFSDEFKVVMDLLIKSFKMKSRYIEVKEGRHMTKILIAQIVYADYYNHYVQIHTQNGIHKTYLSFSEFAEQLLEYPQFMVCYRNVIINMDYVEKLEKRDFLMRTNEKIPINRNRQNELKQQYLDYVFDKMDGGVAD